MEDAGHSKVEAIGSGSPVVTGRGGNASSLAAPRAGAGIGGGFTEGVLGGGSFSPSLHACICCWQDWLEEGGCSSKLKDTVVGVFGR
jgi:hypothetical protein